MASNEMITPVESKGNRIDILESLRVLSPEGVAALAQAARQLVENETGDASA